MSDIPYEIDETDKHYWLYAKGWYQRTNHLTDLLKIHSEWCGCTLDKNDEFWIVNRLTEITFDVIMNNPNKSTIDQFQDFIFGLAPNHCWKIGADEKVYSFNDAIIKQCLSIMRYTTPLGLDPERQLDETILPKSHKQ